MNDLSGGSATETLETWVEGPWSSVEGVRFCNLEPTRHSSMNQEEVLGDSASSKTVDFQECVGILEKAPL